MSAGMDLDTFELELSKRLGELERNSQYKTMWDFLGLAAAIDYISSLDRIIPPHRRAQAVAEGIPVKPFMWFMEQHMPPAYKSFVYIDGARDLPAQMYYILRCGLVHAFSLSRSPNRPAKEGRNESVVLAHRRPNGPQHLQRLVDNGSVMGGALLVFEDLLADVRTGLTSLLMLSRTDPAVTQRALRCIAECPPLAPRMYAFAPPAMVMGKRLVIPSGIRYKRVRAYVSTIM